MDHKIGTDIHNLATYTFLRADNLLLSRYLGKDRIENVYQYKNHFGLCLCAVQIDSKTGRIVGWRIVANERACVLIP
jgi:hypothetical protein